MTYATTTINPHYAARLRRASPVRPTEPDGAIYVRLPRAPVTGSPGPHLTSLYHFDRAGEYGDRSWPGNCGGKLIKDLLNYFKPVELAFDPMSGSGTASDVCQELGVPCITWDIHQGQDACDPTDFPKRETFDFIWAHPPYWRMKLYADDPRDLSRSPTLEHFLRRYGTKVWGRYGFVDAFSERRGWYADTFLAIDQGPIIIMIENHRSGLLWRLFMRDPDVQAGLRRLGFESPRLTS